MFSPPRQGSSVIDLPCVPVIFLPGIMGSRLEIQVAGGAPTDWDPNSAATFYRSWLRAKATEKGDLLHSSNGAAVIAAASWTNADQEARGWGSVAEKYYRSILEALESDLNGDARHPVYAFGYDWRQGNRQSADGLGTFVAQVLDDNDADECVLITHSMGGLVAREAYRSVAGMRGKVAAIVHLAQPVLGAPVAYRRLVAGSTRKHDGWTMNRLMGSTAEEVATILHGVPAAIELLPHDSGSTATAPGHARWLFHHPFGKPAERNLFPGARSHNVYRMSEFPPAIAEPGSKHSGALLTLLRLASSFHDRLGLTSHPHTRVIAGSGVDTDTSTVIALSAAGLKGATVDIDAGRSDAGDATVPAWSASALFPGSTDPLDENLEPEIQRQWVTDGVPHDEFCNDGDVQKAVVTIIDAMLHPPTLRHSGILSEGLAAWLTLAKSLAGDRSAETELRVAKLLAQEGHTVTIAANPTGEKTPDLLTDAGPVEVKLAEGDAASIQGRIEHALLQLTGPGTVVVVRGKKAREPMSTYRDAAEEALGKHFGSDPRTASVRIIEESRLPPLFTLTTTP